MKKFSLIAILFLGILFLENCKKDTVAATATATNKMIANIKDSTWFTDTVTSTLVYNSAAKTKTFTCEGTAFNRRITISLTKNVTSSTSTTSSFPLGTYTVDATTNVQMSFLTPKRNDAGAIVWVPNGTVAPGSGSVIVTKVDSVKNELTGTFSFTTVVNNSDGSVSIANVTGGGLNNVPFTFTTN